jgi:class 3 adenylate cyclase
MSKTIQLLIVDDNRFARSVLDRILTSSNDTYRITEATNGEEALEVIANSTIDFDAFLLDIEMPGIDGVELCKRIRNIKKYIITPILMVTALDEGKKLRDCFHAGANDFVNKPLDPVIVHARLKGLLDRVKNFKALEKLQSSLVRYVSPRTQLMVEKYIDSEKLPPPEEKELCIMFTDIRGFTALSQDINPQDLLERVSQHLGNQVETVYEFGGYVDKFGGDGIMAVFEGDDGAVNACACALEIMKLTAQKPTNNVEFGAMPLGIGIHLGPTMVGNIGGGEHLDYSVIGNTVNLAARICGHAGIMEIMVSETVRDACMSHPLSSQFSFPRGQLSEIRGLNKKMMLYTLVQPQTTG